jgi:hypothetical protein
VQIDKKNGLPPLPTAAVVVCVVRCHFIFRGWRRRGAAAAGQGQQVEGRLPSAERRAELVCGLSLVANDLFALVSLFAVPYLRVLCSWSLLRSLPLHFFLAIDTLSLSFLTSIFVLLHVAQGVVFLLVHSASRTRLAPRTFFFSSSTKTSIFKLLLLLHASPAMHHLKSRCLFATALIWGL